MNWKKFFEHFIHDLRLSPYVITQKTGLTHTLIHRLRTGQAEKPRQNTIKLLEQSTGIKKDNSDPNNITYRKKPVKKYEILDAPIRNGSTVIARLRDGRQIIKKYKALPGNMAMFYSANGDYEPIIVRFSEIEVMFRIVGIWQNLYSEQEELRDKEEMEKERKAKKKGKK